MRNIIAALALVLAASVANAAPIYLSCSGDWVDDKFVHETFSLVVDINKGTVTHGGWTLKIYADDADQILASTGRETKDLRYVEIERVTGRVVAYNPDHTGPFTGTCKPVQKLF
jgi:hypothetical protein